MPEKKNRSPLLQPRGRLPFYLTVLALLTGRPFGPHDQRQNLSSGYGNCRQTGRDHNRPRRGNR